MFKFLFKKININYNYTISLSYFNDGHFLKEQLKAFNDYSHKVKIQIIDDGSDKDPIEKYLKFIPSNIRVFKVLENIKWNIPGVRNLGCMVASTPWVLHLDMDHIIPANSIEKINEINFDDKNKYYSFNRKIGSNNKFTAGTLLIPVEQYWRCGGYDEDFSGTYGYNDPYLKTKLQQNKVKEVRLKHVWFEDHGKKASSTLAREGSEKNKILMKKKLLEHHIPTCHIRFNWKRIK